MSNREKQDLVRDAIASRMETKQAERGGSFLVTMANGTVQKWTWYPQMSRAAREKLFAEGKSIDKLEKPILVKTMSVSRTPKNSKEWFEKKGSARDDSAPFKRSSRCKKRRGGPKS